jgi:hypothetical protein
LNEKLGESPNFTTQYTALSAFSVDLQSHQFFFRYSKESLTPHPKKQQRRNVNICFGKVLLNLIDGVTTCCMRSAEGAVRLACGMTYQQCLTAKNFVVLIARKGICGLRTLIECFQCGLRIIKFSIMYHLNYRVCVKEKSF